MQIFSPFWACEHQVIGLRTKLYKSFADFLITLSFIIDTWTLAPVTWNFVCFVGTHLVINLPGLGSGLVPNMIPAIAWIYPYKHATMCLNRTRIGPTSGRFWSGSGTLWYVFCDNYLVIRLHVWTTLSWCKTCVSCPWNHKGSFPVGIYRASRY